MSDHPFAICLMGPTASGKTDLAVELSTKLLMPIISVDSALVYKGMDIGTAKPTADVLEQAPHRLIDFLDPSEVYSAARFRNDALREMKSITDEGNIPLLVGGTMMYFNALFQGLAELPGADPKLRAAILAEAEQRGWQSLHDELAEVDPEAATRIRATDTQRLQRALEVYRKTGIPLSEWQAQEPEPLPYRFIKLALVPSDRKILHERINQRFDLMLQNGLIEEVRALYERGDLNLDMPSMRAVGYRQVWQYLQGEFDEHELAEKGKAATRQLAKRQLTWLRSMQDINYFYFPNNDLVDEVLNFLATCSIN